MTDGEKMILKLLGEGRLAIDADGAIWRMQTRTRVGRWRPISPRRADLLRADGYRDVRIAVAGTEYRASANRIVWMASNGEIPEGIEVNHRDGNREHNRLGNLELTTKGENLAHSYRELGRTRPTGGKNPRSRLTAEQVAEIRRRGAGGEGRRPLARAFGVTPRAVRMILVGKSWRDEYPALAEAVSA